MKSHSGNNHTLIMLLCCLVPLAAVFAVTTLGVPLSNLMTFGLVLLCPLMHLLMMKGMMGHGSQGKASCHEPEQKVSQPLPTREG